MGQTNGTVYALAVGGGVAYVGGNFTSVRPSGADAGTNETARSGLAAFNASNGQLIGSFDVELNGEVRALALSADGSRLFVGGTFTTVDGTARNRLASVRTSDGTLDTAFSANANASVIALAATSDALYVGGDFTTLKNTTQTRMAKVSPANGAVDTGFSASFDGRVRTIAVAPNNSRVIVGGTFDNTNSVIQGGVASLDPSSGTIMPWASTGIVARPANGGCSSSATGILAQGTVAYVTAEGDEPGCFEGIYAANISDGSLIWNAECLGAAQDIEIVGDWIYKASHQHDCGRQRGGYVGTRNWLEFEWFRMTAFRTSDGVQGHFTPNTNGVERNGIQGIGPRVLATDGTQLFMGGDFDEVDGVGQEGVARFTPSGANSAPAAPPAPIATATNAGVVDIAVPATSDRDDGTLTYRLYRDGGSTPIATQVVESWPFSKPVLRFTDSGLAAGSTHTYTVRANDGTTTSASSPASNTVTVSGADPASVDTVVLAAAPSAYWRLADAAGTVADSSGNGRTGVAQGGVSTGVAGVDSSNAAMALDGSSGYIASSAPQGAAATFSQSVWFKTTSQVGGDLLGFSDAQSGAGTNTDRVVFMENDGKVVFAMRSDAVNLTRYVHIRSPYSLRDGRWHQVAATYDGATMSLYVDGALAATAPLATPQDPGVGYHRVGYANLGGFYTVFGRNFSGNPAPISQYFGGSIDEASFFAGVLSPAQVAEQFAAGIAG
ncbi:MAG: hypothetical protein IT195_08600 [Microthrixaceae bacterium]|nr:hypothetical protein [Microthrixaceae bacterium]